MFDAMRQDQEAADEKAKTHHMGVADLKHGDCFVSPEPMLGVVVFGEVIEHDDKYPEDNEHIRDARLRGYVYARCYSQMCPEGELGDKHITTIQAKISREDFDRAKANGWEAPGCSESS
jgi:hypothetical protein